MMIMNDEEYDFGYRADDDDDDKDNNEDDEGITNCCDMILMIKSTYLNADDDVGNHDNDDHVSSPLDRDSHLHKLHDCKS